MLITCIVFSCVFFTGAVFAEEATASVITEGEATEEGISRKDLEYLGEVMKMIKERYKGEVSDRELIEGAIRGMFDTLDEYTTFFNQKEYDEFTKNVTGEYEGVGVLISQFEDRVVVLQVLPGSPAEKEGIKAGDIIIEVDGISMLGKDVDYATSLLVGPSGSKVTVAVSRTGEQKLITFEIERGLIKINPVAYKILDGNIGYLKLAVFSNDAVDYVDEALAYFDENKVEKVILDLRNNSGGILDQAIKIARRLVPEGAITIVDYKEGEDEVFYSDLKEKKYELVVLVNGMTASASEVLAGAIQDNHAGVLVGTKTYGKAKIQYLIPIMNPESYKEAERQLGEKIINAYELLYYNILPTTADVIGYSKITVAEYLTPSGNLIDGTGLSPDVEVELDLDPDLNPNSIEELKKAIKYKLGDESFEIYYAEKILKLAGYDIDEPDYFLDERTFDAMHQFQADSELFPYGVIDFATQDALNRKLEELRLQYDTQLVKGIEILNSR